jgi:hypothetical protein
MEVHIGEVNSTIRATDGSTLLSPEVLRQIVAAVREQLKTEHDHDKRVADERKLVPGVSHGDGGGM